MRDEDSERGVKGCFPNTCTLNMGRTCEQLATRKDKVYPDWSIWTLLLYYAYLPISLMPDIDARLTLFVRVVVHTRCWLYALLFKSLDQVLCSCYIQHTLRTLCESLLTTGQRYWTTRFRMLFFPFTLAAWSHPPATHGGMAIACRNAPNQNT